VCFHEEIRYFKEFLWVCYSFLLSADKTFKQGVHNFKEHCELCDLFFLSSRVEVIKWYCYYLTIAVIRIGVNCSCIVFFPHFNSLTSAASKCQLLTKINESHSSTCHLLLSNNTQGTTVLSHSRCCISSIRKE